jgi:hypothetical protein
MLIKKRFLAKLPLFVVFFLLNSLLVGRACSANNDVKLVVWVNTAVTQAYTFDYKDFVKQQQEIAKYFTAKAWVSFSKALIDAKIVDSVKKNSYFVSAVPTLVPTIKQISDDDWEATIPLLVLYKNESYKQKQNLNVIVRFIKTSKEGVDGYAITSMQTVSSEEPCQCEEPKLKVSLV